MAFRWCIAASLALGSSAEDMKGLGCTAIVVDGAASKDGSAYAGMNADCNACDPRLAWIPGGEHEEGAERPLYVFSGSAPRFVGYGRGKFYEPKEGQKESPSIGSIPQARKTFGYWEAVLPLMNEKGLSMGESSCAARLLNYPKGAAPATGDPRTGKPALEGLVDLSNLMQIAMERCATARCAVELMGRLSDEYGFFPMVGEWSEGLEVDGKTAFDDGGEALTLADSSGEAWIFHVVGGVHGVAKSLWAAMRVPRGHAAFVANNFIIRDIPVKPTEDFLFSEKIHEAAVAAGFWDGKGTLDFARTFAPDALTFQAPPGSAPIPLYASLRQWRLVTLAAPEAFGSLRCPLDPWELPATVKVEGSFEPTRAFGFLADIYEGTEFDLTQGILAGPFGSPFRAEGGNATAHVGQIPRGISIQRTSYSLIGQSRPRAEPVLWFAPDTPVTSVYAPFYPSVGEHMADAYAKGTLLEFSRESAFWAFDFVSNWASLQNWKHASEHFLRPLQLQFYADMAKGMQEAEEKAKKHGHHVLAEYQVAIQEKLVKRWWKLADELIVAYNDGFFNNVTSNQPGQNLGYPEWWAREIGFNADVHPIFVKRNTEPEQSCQADPRACPPGFQPVASPLPGGYDFTTASWLFGKRFEGQSLAAAGPRTLPEAAVQLSVYIVLLLAGVVMGRLYERRVAARSDNSDSAYLRLA